jgi:hypothetical protein
MSKSKSKSRTKKAVVDSKSAAANDKPKTEVTLTKKAINARSEGVRLYQLAGRPTKSDFIKLCGKKGPAMTWTARAEHLGVATLEEAAEKFAALKAGK